MKNAAVISNIKKDSSLSLTKKIASILLSAGATVFLPKSVGEDINGATLLPESDLFDMADFAVTVGGDGTFLDVAEQTALKNIPVIGVNLGRLGFMAELEPNEINLLTRILDGNYSVENRMMLDVEVVRDNAVICSYKALNDIVVSKGNVSKIAELDLFCNSTFLSHFNADGLIVSTPTGSTAYSLSAGGAIIDPTIDCLLLTPVCPHSFVNSRPIVFSPSSVMEIQDVQDREENTYLTVDGRVNVKLACYDTVRVVASKITTKIIKLKADGFYNRVYQKIAEKNL